MGALQPGDVLRLRCIPANDQDNPWNEICVGVSPFPGTIRVRPVSAFAGGEAVDERELLEFYDVIERAPEVDEPGERLAWWGAA